MKLVDLTMDFEGERFAPEIKREEIHLCSGLTEYTGVVYTMINDGMTGTYIDFPGHIAETDNGMYADNVPPEFTYRVPAQVIRLHRESDSGAVTGEELEKALGDRELTDTLVINALGKYNHYEVGYRSVFLDESAVQWIIDRRVRILISDIYESNDLHGVFLRLFRAGITTVCKPVNLIKLPEDKVILSVMYVKIPQVTQLPCRIVAEI